MPFDLTKYLERIDLKLEGASAPTATLDTLRQVMSCHMRSISFENMDVVCGRTISINADDIYDKIVKAGRGGYCFEQNGLLSEALKMLGYTVSPLLCRVRWGKAPKQETAFTHMCLKVQIPNGGGAYLSDVGFAGTNSMAPVDLSTPEPQRLPEGTFHIANRDGYSFLECQDRNDASSWLPLYCWHSVPALVPDLEQSNWFSCTYASARFTNQFFSCRIIGSTRHHVLNGEYVVREMGGEVKSREKVSTKERLLDLVTGVFGLSLPEDTDGLDRFLTK